MSKQNNLTDFLTSLATKIREKLNTTNKINPQDFETKIDEVYMAGKNDEYNAFWDAYQQNGNRTDYRHGFAGKGWTGEAFNPKYGGTVTGADYMFYMCGSGSDTISSIDLTSAPTFDFSNCTNYTQWLSYSKVTKVPKVDLTKVSLGAYYLFQNATSLETVTELHFPDTKISYANATMSAFTGCTALKNITVTGTILNGGFDLHWSTLLTIESLTSILTALTKDSSKASGLKITFSTAAQTKINADTIAKAQYDEAIAAGWTIAFA